VERPNSSRIEFSSYEFRCQAAPALSDRNDRTGRFACRSMTNLSWQGPVAKTDILQVRFGRDRQDGR
jgi:hypothetical protein